VDGGLRGLHLVIPIIADLGPDARPEWVVGHCRRYWAQKLAVWPREYLADQEDQYKRDEWGEEFNAGAPTNDK